MRSEQVEVETAEREPENLAEFARRRRERSVGRVPAVARGRRGACILARRNDRDAREVAA
jgi:hypothetical protein